MTLKKIKKKTLNNKQFCLVLSANFVPIRIDGVRAIMEDFVVDKGKAMDIETFQQYTFDEWIGVNNDDSYDTTIKTEKLVITIPEIFVLNKIVKPHKATRKNSISRIKVYERDNYTCRYCDCSLNSKNRTIDHIIPTSRGGDKYSYKNVVACCRKCNTKKGNKTLEELGLNPIVVEDPVANPFARIPITKWKESWNAFIKKT